MRSGAIHTKLITDVGDADRDAAAWMTTANEPA
jgi:hypothetical protein